MKGAPTTINLCVYYKVFMKTSTMQTSILTLMMSFMVVTLVQRAASV